MVICVKMEVATLGSVEARRRLSSGQRESNNWVPQHDSGCLEWSNIGFLTKFDQRCEEGQALQGFMLHEGGCEGENMRIEYGCKTLRRKSGALDIESYRSYKVMTHGRNKELVGAEMNCDVEGRKGVMSQFQLHAMDTHKYVWGFECSFAPKHQELVKDCHTEYSNAKSNGEAKIDLLNGQDVKCPRDEFLTALEYTHYTGSQYRWKFNCCRLDLGEKADSNVDDRFGDVTVSWVQETNIPAGSLTFSSSWDMSKDVTENEAQSSEFSSSMSNGWEVNACVSVTYSYESDLFGKHGSIGAKGCGGSFGSKSSTSTNSQMVSSSVSNGYAVGETQECTIQMPDYCEEKACSIWRWCQESTS